MSIERIALLRTHGSVIRGAYLVGQASWGSAGGPGGTGSIVSDVRGWDATMGMHCRYVQLQSLAQSFGSNGYAITQRATQGWYPGALFPPFGTGNRIFRLRDVIRFRVAQADANNPKSRFFYGVAQEFASTSPQGTLDYDQGWVGFYSSWVGTTQGNWFAKVVDDALNIRHSADLGVGTDAPHMLRIDIDPIEGEIRFYIDEVLKSTYTVASGFMNVTDISPEPWIGWGVNPGYITGASVNTLTDTWTEVMGYGSAFHTVEVP